MKLRSEGWSRLCSALVLLLLITAACACTTRMYTGPSRPGDEVARLDTWGFTVHKVDQVQYGLRIMGKTETGTPRAIDEGRPNRTLEFLPGCHCLTVSLRVAVPAGVFTLVEESESVSFCFDFQPGKRYRLTYAREGDAKMVRGSETEEYWHPVIVQKGSPSRKYLAGKDSACGPKVKLLSVGEMSSIETSGTLTITVSYSGVSGGLQKAQFQMSAQQPRLGKLFVGDSFSLAEVPHDLDAEELGAESGECTMTIELSALKETVFEVGETLIFHFAVRSDSQGNWGGGGLSVKFAR